MIMLTKLIYATQPYYVGRNKSSLAVIIPSKVRKECNINTSTIFAIRIDRKRKNITLKTLNNVEEVENKKEKVAGQEFQILDQQGQSHI
jgi:bifunctional DNA-binding transcriptional regulator/antitoxin component of YhaV-PrlF toxin-antitoxin module